jgi:hypothetical protein
MPVKVINHNSSRFIDRFDGKDYVFEPHDPVLMSDEAARHIFGYGDGDKAPYLSRIGKMKTTQLDGAGGFREAMKWLEKIEFREMVVQFVERPAEIIPFSPESEEDSDSADAKATA